MVENKEKKEYYAVKSFSKELILGNQHDKVINYFKIII